MDKVIRSTKGTSFTVDLARQDELVDLAERQEEFREEILELITQPFAAFRWAVTIGDTDVMLGRLVRNPDPCAAFMWASTFPNDRRCVSFCITNPLWAIKWAQRFPEDLAEMRERITTPMVALRWAQVFPWDRDSVRELITDPEVAFLWVCSFSSPDEIRAMRNIVDGTEWDDIWRQVFSTVNTEPSPTQLPPPNETQRFFRDRHRERH